MFNVIVDRILTKLNTPQLQIGDNVSTRALAYADDIVLFSESETGMQTLLDQLKSAAGQLGMLINGSKTKVMSFGLENDPLISLDGAILEVVPNFKYLGSVITGNTSAVSEEVDARIGKASGVYANLRKCLWSRPEISIKTKVQVFKSMVLSVLLYGSECWTLRAEDLRKLEVFLSTRLRWMLNLRLTDRISNAEVRRRCCGLQTIETIIRGNRLRWFGRVCRMDASRQPKAILNSTVPNDWRISGRGGRKHWLQQVGDDPAPLHLDVDYGGAAAQNRAQWKAILRDVVHAPTTRTTTLPYLR